MGLRQDRLADEIRDLIATDFAGGQMSDPRLSAVTVTAVRLSGDLQIATVYYRVMGHTTPLDDVEKALARTEGFFKRKLARALDVRRVPSIRFYYDESVERGSHIESLLANLNR